MIMSVEEAVKWLPMKVHCSYGEKRNVNKLIRFLRFAYAIHESNYLTDQEKKDMVYLVESPFFNGIKYGFNKDFVLSILYFLDEDLRFLPCGKIPEVVCKLEEDYASVPQHD